MARDAGPFFPVGSITCGGALQIGDDMRTVQENLGHATAAFTLDISGHVPDEMKQASASRMEKLIQGFAAGQADSGLAVSNA